MKKVLFFSFATLATLTLVSCSQPNPQEKVSEGVAKTKPVADGQVYEGEHFSVTIPKDWKMIDFSRKDWETVVGGMSKDPAYKDVAPMMKQFVANKQFKFFAFAPEFSVSNFQANLNAIGMEMPANVTAKQLFDANRDQLKQMAGKDISYETMTINGAEAAKFVWSAPAAVKLATTTIIAVKGGQQGVFTFSLPDEKAKGSEATIDKIVNSITFK